MPQQKLGHFFCRLYHSIPLAVQSLETFDSDYFNLDTLQKLQCLDRKTFLLDNYCRRN